MGLWLYLDDVRTPPPGWTLVRNVAAARELLRAGGVERLSLDNDLGCDGCFGEDETPHHVFRRLCALDCGCPCHEEGYKLLDWMIDEGVWPTEKPLVHSANPARAMYMRARIEEEWEKRRKA